MIFDFNIPALLAVALVVYVVTRHVFRSDRSKRFPPGPVPLPLLGNILDMPSTYQHLTFTKWREEYGDIVSLTVFGQRYVILNSLKTSLDILEKRGAVYSDRPYLPMAGKLMGWDQIATLRRYGDEFRYIRRLMHQTVGSRGQPEKVAQYHHIEEYEMRRFLRRLLDTPEGFAAHIRTATGAFILKLAYGYDVQDGGPDELVATVDRAVQGWIKTSAPGSYLVDVFPALEHVPAWVPGIRWREQGLAWRREVDSMMNVPYAFAKANALTGEDADHFVGSNLASVKDDPEEHLLIAAAASLYAGGADTTVSARHSFFLAMTRYPEVCKKAQEEIDRVVGNGCLPTFADRDNLPYIHALCLEVLRWQPIGPNGLPHCLMQDDHYNGFFFPKGTIVVSNIWAIMHDPMVYVDPMEFRPERFIATSKHEPEQDPRLAVFGFGRRVCPGINLAEAAVYIMIVTTLAVYDIGKVVEDGVEITPPFEHTSGTIIHPKPFKCTIRPRSAQAEVLIRSL